MAVMAKGLPSQKAEAKAERDWRITLLKRCECAYPVQVFRNRSGHADDCPSHKLYMEVRG